MFKPRESPKIKNVLTPPLRFCIVKYMSRKFTAIFKKSGKWYLGWIEEIPGVNTQGRTFKETKENLREALFLILEANRTLSQILR